MVVCGGNAVIDPLVGINLLVFFVTKRRVTTACSKSVQEKTYYYPKRAFTLSFWMGAKTSLVLK